MRKLLQDLVDKVGEFPRRLLGDKAHSKIVREAFHFAGGFAVALLTSFNGLVQLMSCLIVLGVVVYGELGDIKKGSPRIHTLLDLACWTCGMVVGAIIMKVGF